MNRALLTFCTAARDAIDAVARATGGHRGAVRQLQAMDEALLALNAAATKPAKKENG